MNNNISNKGASLSQWLSYIKSICLNHYHDSMENVRCIAKKLNLLHVSGFIITVSGTNGKGSTCFLLERFFINLGYSVGLYSSPHLFNYHERIRINGKYIKNPAIHISAFEKIDLLCQKIQLSYFEFITLSALLIFQSSNLDIVILEVGLGGRLDATNIIDANIAIITNVDLDHTQYLGKTRYSIGYEKSGIFRKNITAVIGDNNIPYSIYEAANFYKVSLNRVRYEWNWYVSGKNWFFYDKKGILNNLPIPRVSLSSAALAVAALRISHFNFDRTIITNSLKQVFLPGRFHTIHKKPRIIVDVGHNPHATRFLNHQLQQILNVNKNIKIYGIVGILFNKDIKNIILNLVDIIDYWRYTVLKTCRTAQACDLKSHLPKHAVFSVSIKHAIYELIKKVRSQDIILIFGSFFAVSEAITAMHLYRKDNP